MRKKFSTQEEAYAWLASIKLVHISGIDKAVYEKAPTVERHTELDRSDVPYLQIDEIRVLLQNLRTLPSKDTYLIAKLCLATGAKWGEIELIKRNQIKSIGVELLSSPKINSRFIPLENSFFEELTSFSNGKKQSQRVFKDSYRVFRRVAQKSRISLPEWQLTHILRNTFASYFLINGGGLPALKKILGHKTISAAMKYTAVMSDDVAQAKELNPLVTLGKNGN